MTRQGPTLRLLVVCDGCEHLRKARSVYEPLLRCSHPQIADRLGVTAATAVARLTPEWCPLAHLREVTPAEDELRRNLVAPMAEPASRYSSGSEDFGGSEF